MGGTWEDGDDVCLVGAPSSEEIHKSRPDDADDDRVEQEPGPPAVSCEEHVDLRCWGRERPASDQESHPLLRGEGMRTIQLRGRAALFGRGRRAAKLLRRPTADNGTLLPPVSSSYLLDARGAQNLWVPARIIRRAAGSVGHDDYVSWRSACRQRTRWSRSALAVFAAEKSCDCSAGSDDGGHPERDQVRLDAGSAGVAAGSGHRRVLPVLRSGVIEAFVETAGGDHLHGRSVRLGDRFSSWPRSTRWRGHPGASPAPLRGGWVQAAGAGRPAGRLGSSRPSSSPDFQSLGAGPIDNCTPVGARA